MVMRPFEEEEAGVNQDGSGADMITQTESPAFASQPKNRIKAHTLDRQKKLLTIILKLAQVKAYNEYGNIRATDGKYRYDIVPLLTYALSRDQGVHGLDDFVALLKEAGVTPDLILNENLRMKLDSFPTFRRRPHLFPKRPQASPSNIGRAVMPVLERYDAHDNSVESEKDMEATEEVDATQIPLPESDDPEELMDDDVQGVKRKRVSEKAADDSSKTIKHDTQTNVNDTLKKVGWESKQ